MLVLSNYNCEYIELSDTQLESIIADPTNVESVEITATLNCCQPAIQEVIDLNKQEWILDFPTSNTLTIETIKIKNIVTGEIFDVISGNYLVGDYSCQTGDINNLFTLVQDWFTTNTATTVTQSYIYDPILNLCQYIISDLPANYIMVEMTLLDSCPQTSTSIPFIYNALQNIFIDENKIYITPAFFSNIKLQDGVYKFVITVKYENGDTYQVASCFFYDCVTKCLVSKEISKLKLMEIDDTNLFLKHYILGQSSNCNCNCDELCVIYEELHRELCEDLNCQDCGCN